jgi:hypothetical protein
LRSLDGDSECSDVCNDLEECSSSNSQPSCIEEEICSSRDPAFSDLATDDSAAVCSSVHSNICNPENFCEMDSVGESVGVLPCHESVLSEIQILRKELYDELVVSIRHEVGDIKDLNDVQVFLKFWKALTALHDSLRPERSVWPAFFLDVFVPDSINWLAHVRSERILQIEELLSTLEVHMQEDLSPHMNSQNSMDPDCDKLAEEDVLSSDYEGVSGSTESDVCGQHDKEELVPKDEPCSSMVEEGVPVSDHCSQSDQSHGEVILCTEEISELLAQDFERCWCFSLQVHKRNKLE